MKFVARLFMTACLAAFGMSAAANGERGLTALRSAFLQAEQYIKQDREDDYFALANTLKAYPLYPYLQYQWLTNHLDDEKSVRAFLLDHADTRYASLLHRKWMAHLGRQRQWPTFIEYFNHSKDTELRCYYAQAQYAGGETQAALESAKQFWLSGKSLPPACQTLFELPQTSTWLTPDLIRQRFRAALKLNNAALAKQLLTLFDQRERALADAWLKLHEQPQLLTQPEIWRQDDAQAGPLFAHAMGRWLESDPLAALSAWDAHAKSLNLPAEIVADTEKRLGMALAFRRDKRAYAKLTRFAGDDESAREWRVRAALNQQQWHEARAAIADLPETARQDDKWQYWLARALDATGQAQEAAAIFQTLATHRGFYGFLAAERLGRDIQLNHQPVGVSAREVDALQKSAPFRVVDELLAMDRKTEAAGQWWHAVADLDNRQLQAAAKLAQDRQWPSMAIFTLAKARQWDDLELRFPLWFNKQIQDNAERNRLDPALVFALIRQESAFDEFAGSPAGAIGLMQVMPKTARQIAGELGQDWRNDFNLLNPDINIRYGSYYFNKVLSQFDGHFVLATAAYNAGANRVKQWLPKDQALPADIWIETIPYKETRGYVSSVLMYTLIYQRRLNRDGLKIADLMRTISPG
ncbi:transglycosylase SLT domain-containing protein [Methylomonas sp. SURF-2]|uniref:Transglycosylase SLT domain-containing protein n=1 Tax=Methylomonas subterranea TaxID=2952225 RepID=A0ABT1TD50_9GAMM|nr:transglycosylase SLT domain-containing protein [Methylomonas sp. SURF-2]MCQ8103022.1 transglycosylase SLT domain-containing protein [Methylomonas sp. SURF-2]